MQDYANFISKGTRFQPRAILKIGGVDVSSRLIEDHFPKTDALLDTPTLNIFTTARAIFCLDNSDNAFNTKADSNFFTELTPARDANGWQTPAEVSVVFEGDPNAPTTPKIFFVGYVEEIVEMSDPRWVQVLLLDYSGLLQQSVVEDFGRLVRASLAGIEDGPDYSSVNPVFNLPRGSAPVSRNSFSASVGGVDLTVLPTLPSSGRALSSEYAAVDEVGGRVFFGADLEDGVDTPVHVDFKSAYRYRTPEALVEALLDASGVYSDLTMDERIFASSLIESPELEYSRAEMSSHGRPQVGSVTSVMRWIRSDVDGFYMGGSRHLFRYRRKDDATGTLDEWDLLSSCPDLNASIIYFEKVDSDFYVVTISDWEGRMGKLWKVTNALSSNMTEWTPIDGANPSAEHFFEYRRPTDATVQRDYVADNRKGFVVESGYLYYVFGDGSEYGIRRVNLFNNVVSTVISQTVSNSVTSAASWDFVIGGTNLYAFVCQRPLNPSSKWLRVYRMGLDGSGSTEIFAEEFSASLRHEPVMVSDVVVRGTNFYFVLMFSRDEARVGFSELCQLSTSGGTRFKLKDYENSLYAARSLVVHSEGSDQNIYFVEGTWLSAISEYPTTDDAGHLGRIDPHGMVVDLGPVWQSFRDSGGTGFGHHASFASNLHSDGESLHLISGYGLLADPSALPNVRTIQSRNNSITEALDNWVWLQYGKKLATKISVFPTNDKTVWSLLEELARVCDFELGWTSGQDEIEDFKQTYPHFILLPKGYMFFRPRGSQDPNFQIDESDLVQATSRLDTTLIFNRVAVPYGSGVRIATDESDRTRYLPLSNSLLSDADEPWAELIGESVLERQRMPRLKTDLPMKFSPHLVLGQRVSVTSEYHSFEDVPFRVTAVRQDLNLWQTVLEMREDLESDPFSLPAVDDLVFEEGDSVSGRLPEAVGGSGNLTYTLENRPSWLSFLSGVREYSGTAAAVDVELIYRVTDSSVPPVSRTRKFRLKVTAPEVRGMLAFQGTLTPPPVARVGCQIPQITLPPVVGGVLPLSKMLSDLPGGYVSDLDAGTIDGVPTTVGTTEMTYDVEDSASSPVMLSLSFDLIVESVPAWVGLGKVGDNYLLLDRLTNVARAYNSMWQRVPSADIMLPAGTYVDADGDGTFFMALESTTRQLRFWNAVGEQQASIQLPAGSWVACCATPTRRYALNTTGDHGVCFHGYDAMGSELVAERILLEHEGSYVSMAILDGKFYVCLDKSNLLVAWDLASKVLDTGSVKMLVRGSSDWVGITGADSAIQAIRAISERAVSV